MASKASERALNHNQRRFAEEYLIDGNGTQAAIRAGYSPATAKIQASRLLTNDNVRRIISEGQIKQSEDSGLTAELVRTTLRRIITADPRRLFDEQGDLKQIADLDDDTAFAMAGVEITENLVGGDDDKVLVRTRKYKFPDKNASLVTAAKILSMLVEKVDHTTGGEKMQTVVILPHNERHA